MSKLTEPMIIARTKCSDLNVIKKLNCWGNELSDVSLVQRMPNVEVLAFSVNNICSLADFQHCGKLSELYLRKNKISSINEICYLQHLPNLKNLNLIENPCTNSDHYRMSVVKALPRLKTLDDQEVSDEERRAAMRQGHDLIHPEDETEEGSWPQDTDYQEHRMAYTNGVQPLAEASSEQCWEVDLEENEPTATVVSSTSQSFDSAKVSPGQSPPGMESPEPPRCYQSEYNDRRNANYDNSHSPTEYLRQPASSSHQQQSSSQVYQQSSQPYYNAQEEEYYRAQQQPRHRFSPGSHPQPPLSTTRRKSRTSNILSAVLCLLKELDYQSLEVVDTTVNARMNELMHEHTS